MRLGFECAAFALFQLSTHEIPEDLRRWLILGLGRGGEGRFQRRVDPEVERRVLGMQCRSRRGGLTGWLA